MVPLLLLEKNFALGNASWIEKIALVPYTKFNGEVPMDFLFVTLSTQSENFNLESQLLWFSSSNFLIILTRILFDESARPLA